eukprot:scaffold32671_cov65-Phaeocystis_antarctica.AAC.2
MRAIHMCMHMCMCIHVRVKSKPAAEVPPGGGHRLMCEGAAEPVVIKRGLRDDYVESILRDALEVSGSLVF